jgi:alpha-tubulin suppressor-like RCC1 family protein
MKFSNIHTSSFTRPLVLALLNVLLLSACGGGGEPSNPGSVSSDASAKVATGEEFSCAVKQNGSAACWGANNVGQLGDGSITDKTIATDVFGLNSVRSIAANYAHACALKQDGTVACWGWNGNGQLGDGTTTYKTVATTVSGLVNVEAITTGVFHTCALKQDSSVACWGANTAGQLGDGTKFMTRTLPAPVPGLTNVASIASGLYHTCASKQDGTVVCWGLNSYGQLGDGTTVDKLVPTPCPR